MAQGEKNRRPQPDLGYYPRLLSFADFVISPLSTMMVDSAILNTPVLALAYDDGIHYTTPRNALKYYIHFEGVTDLSGFAFCYKKQDLESAFLKMIKN